MKRQTIQAATLATAVAALVAGATHAPRHAGAKASGVTLAGNSCSGKNGCGAKPKDPNEKKAPQRA